MWDRDSDELGLISLKADSPEILVASADGCHADQPTTREAHDTIRAVGLRQILFPDGRLIIARSLGKMWIIPECVVLDDGLDGLAVFLVGDTSFDDDSSFQADIERHGIKSGCVRNLDCRGEIRLTRRGDHDHAVTLALGKADQAIATVTVGGRLDSGRTSERRIGPTIGGNLHAGERLAGIFVFDNAGHRLCGRGRVLEMRAIELPLAPVWAAPGEIYQERFGVAGQDADLFRRDRRPGILDFDDPLATHSGDGESPLGIGHDRCAKTLPPAFLDRTIQDSSVRFRPSPPFRTSRPAIQGERSPFFASRIRTG